ncbi:MAG: response regulator transcription factor [Sphingobacteriales bacterium]|nr:MAG: response regulator transcription factor [Sphingobacteriales bacterium]
MKNIILNTEAVATPAPLPLPCHLVVEDHPLVSAFFEGLLQNLYPDNRRAVCCTMEETFAFVKKNPVSMIILDINLPDGMSLSWIDTLKRMQPDMAILVVSAEDEAIFGPRALQMRADGYINKKASVEDITLAIRTVQRGRKYVSPELLENMISKSNQQPVPDNPFEKLTNREFEIAVLLMKGYTAVESGRVLSVQRSTISTHKIKIMDKLGVEDLNELKTLGVRYNVYNNPDAPPMLTVNKGGGFNARIA